MIRACLVLLLALPLAASEAAYDDWAAGRPAEALPALHAAALASGRWDAWLDLGLAAADAGRRGPAIVWLLEAHRRAPQRPEPRAALATLDVALAPGWVERIGVAALPGAGRWALPLALLVGVAGGWALAGRRGRTPAAAVAALGLVVLLPGALATWIDGQQGWAAVAQDSALLDASGRTLRPLPAGTVLRRSGEAGWAGNVAVAADGVAGWVAGADLVATP